MTRSLGQPVPLSLAAALLLAASVIAPVAAGKGGGSGPGAPTNLRVTA